MCVLTIKSDEQWRGNYSRHRYTEQIISVKTLVYRNDIFFSHTKYGYFLDQSFVENHVASG